MTRMQRHLILVAVSMAAMLHAMAMTSVSVVLPQMQGSMSAAPDQISWVLTLSVVGAVVATPLSGWMVDRMGWRSVMLITVSGFGVATILCATAQNLGSLLVYRTLQGAFGAPIIVVSQAILLAVFPKDEVAWSQSAWGIATVLGQAMAPVLGGYLADVYDWRWAFWFLVPMSVVSFGMVLAWIPKGETRTYARLDWWGFLSLSVAIVALQLTVDRGERLYWFESPEITLYAATAVISFAVFIVRNLSHVHPFVDFSLFKDLRFTLGVVMIILFGMANFLPNWIFPAIMGGLQGYPESAVGWSLFMRGAGMLVGFFVVAKTAGPYPRATMATGFLMAGVSGFQGVFFTLDVSYQAIMWSSAIQGFGTALMWTPIIIVGFSGLSPSQMAQASGVFHLLRQLSTSVFVAVVVAVSLRTGTISYYEMSAQVTPFSHGLVFNNAWDVNSQAGLAQLSVEISRRSRMIGYTNAFVVYTVACVVGAALSFFCKSKK